jgi:uncharacterized protein
MRTLLIALAIATIALIARFLLRQRQSAARRRTEAGDMVRCAHCGLHVPAHEAIAVAGRWYCGEAHRAADEGKRG